MGHGEGGIIYLVERGREGQLRRITPQRERLNLAERHTGRRTTHACASWVSASSSSPSSPTFDIKMTIYGQEEGARGISA